VFEEGIVGRKKISCVNRRGEGYRVSMRNGRRKTIEVAGEGGGKEAQTPGRFSEPEKRLG